MPTPHELEAKFWKTLGSERTMMLGLEGAGALHPRPMTGLIEHDHGPIWFFSARGNGIVQNLHGRAPALATFASKGHDLFATVTGTLILDQDRAVIDRLWNPFVAAWFEGGKDDPQLALLRFDAETAEIWLDANSLIAGVKMLFGIDPKKDYKDNVAEVRLG
jgi:general stress protein 26